MYSLVFVEENFSKETESGWVQVASRIHIDPAGIPDASRALVNRHEINSRKERDTLMIRG